MDTTTIESPLVRAWQLLADLAVQGRTYASTGELADLARRIVDSVRMSLPCPWGMLVLQPERRAPLLLSWGIDDVRRTELAARNGSPLPPGTFELPLSYDGEALGALFLGASEETSTILNPAFVHALRSQVELLIGSCLRVIEQQDRARELFVIAENAQILTSSQQSDLAIGRALENIVLTLHADRCALYQYDAEASTQLSLIGTYATEGHDTPADPQTLTLTSRVLLDVLRADTAVTLDAGGSKDLQVLRPADCRQVLLAPLNVRDQPVGLLIIGFSERSTRLERAEVTLAQTLATHVALAMLTTTLALSEQRRTSELNVLQQVSQQLGGDASLEELLSRMLRALRPIVRFAGAEICLADPSNQGLRVVQTEGMRSGGRRALGTTVSDGLTGWLARHRRILRIPDYQRAPVRPSLTRFADGSQITAYIGLPLQAGDQFIGTLELFSKRPNGFSNMDERLLTILASQVAQAIERTRQSAATDEHLRSRLQQIKALQRISRELIGTLYLHSILGFALEQALRATLATSGYIALRGYSVVLENPAVQPDEALGVADLPRTFYEMREADDAGVLRIIAADGYSGENEQLLNQTLLDGRTVAEATVGSGESTMVDELAGDDRPNGFGPLPVSVLVAPIYYEAQVIGVVNLHAQSAGAFDHDALEFVRAVADQVALAIGNETRYVEQRRQREQLQQRARTLNEVLRIGQALRADRSLEEVLDEISFSITETIGFRTVVFYTVDAEDTARMRFSSGAGLPLFELDELRGVALDVRVMESLFDPSVRVGRCYLVLGDLMRALAAGKATTPAQLPSDAGWPFERWHSDDALLLPLYSTGARLVGLMWVTEPYDRQTPTRRSVEPLEILADQAAIAIENADLLNAARWQANQMTSLYRVSAAAVSTLDLDVLLETAYREIVGFLGEPAYCYVASFEPLQRQVRFELFKRNGEDLLSYAHTSIPLSGLTQWIIEHGEVVSIGDLQSKHDNAPVAPVVIDTLVRAWVGVPLRSQDQVIGVLSVQSMVPHAYSERAVQFLSAVGNQLAVALERVRLFRERERRIAELDIINRIGRTATSTLDIEPMLNQVYNELAEFLRVDAFFGVIYRQDWNQIDVGLLIDEGVRTFERYNREPRPGGLIEQIIRTRQPLLFGDLRSEQDDTMNIGTFGNNARESASWLGVPLMIGSGEVAGVLSVQSYTPNLYGERELSFMATVASQVALGVQNARLFAETRASASALQSKVGELSALLESARALTSSLGPNQTFETVLTDFMRVVQKRLHVESVGLWRMINQEELAPVMMVGVPLEAARRLRVPFGQGMIGRVAAEAQPLIVTDAQTQSNSLYPDFNQSYGLHAFMGVPVLYSQNTVGVLSVMAGRERQFSQDEVLLLAGMADQAAIALENARLFAEREQRIAELTTLNRISQATTGTLELHALLKELHRGIGEVIEVFDTAESFIALYDERTHRLSFPVNWENGREVPFADVYIIENNQGLSHRVIMDRQPLLLHTLAEVEAISSEPPLTQGRPIASWLGVPIIGGNTVFGLISVQSYEPYAYTEDHVRFLTTVANGAAIAINNVLLFQERERRIRELETFNQIGQALSAVTRLDDLTMLLYQQTGKLLEANNFHLALYNEQRDEMTFPLVFERGQPIQIAPTRDHTRLAFHIVRTRAPLLLSGPDATAEARALGLRPSGSLGKSWLGVPMIAADRVVGVMSVKDYERAHAYTQNEVQLLSTLASWGGIALENARLLTESRQSVQEMTALYDTSVALSKTFDEAAIQQIVATRAQQLFGAELGAVMVFDHESHPVQNLVLNGATVLEAATALPQVLAQLVPELLASDPPLALPDVAEQPGLSIPLNGGMLRGLLGTLVGPKEHPLGVIWVGAVELRDWPERERSMLSLLANQFQSALANARLFAEVHRFNAELERRVEERTSELSAEKARLEAVHNITLELTASLEEIDQTLNKALELAAQAVGARRGSIMLRQEQDRNELMCRAVLTTKGLAQTQNILIAFEQGIGLAGWVMEHQESVCIADVRYDARWLREEGRADEVRSVIAAPLMTQDGPQGVLMLSSPEINFFTQEQVQLLTTIASEVGIVIHNATLYTVINQVLMRQGDLLTAQREEYSKSQAILQSLGEGVIVLDEQYNVVLFNAAAETMLGVPARYLVGGPVYRIAAYRDPIMTADRAELILEALRKGLQALESSHIYNAMIELPEPSKSIAVNFAPWVGPQGGGQYGHVVVLRDITREIEADRAKRNFISSVSHELRTPLTSIKGYVDLLLLGAAGQITEGQQSFLTVVKNNANRLMELINDILEIGRIDEGKVQLHFDKVRIEDLVADVMQTMRAEIQRKQMHVTVDIESGLPEITVDPRRLTQVIMNLVSNAVKYTFPQGVIRVQALLNPAGMLQMDVVDNGVGLTPDQQKKLFRRFYRADNPLSSDAGGTGLGLSIAKSFIELHGGEMWVESEIGKGSTFSFIIPIEQRPPTAAAEERK